MKLFSKHTQSETGFTIIEMIVVVAIISIVTMVVLFNNTRLNSALLVSNTAYEIGLIVRETQVAGLGVKATTDGFSASHGVHFDIATPSIVTLFADKNKNGTYDAAGGEMTQEYEIKNDRAGKILGMCGRSGMSPTTIPYCTVSNTKSTVDVVFTRPNPEAFFKVRDISTSGFIDYLDAIVINVGFIGDVCRSITIEKTGAVSIDQAFCPPIL